MQVEHILFDSDDFIFKYNKKLTAISADLSKTVAARKDHQRKQCGLARQKTESSLYCWFVQRLPAPLSHGFRKKVIEFFHATICLQRGNSFKPAPKLVSNTHFTRLNRGFFRHPNRTHGINIFILIVNIT